MWGIVCTFASCCLFIHLGLGEAIEHTLRIRFVLFRCVKCLTFWTVTGYSLLIVTLPVEVSLCAGFISAYAALWADLLLGILANKYEKLTESMDAEESPRDSASHRIPQDKGHEGEESEVP